MNQIHKEVELGTNARLVIPLEVRQALHCQPGDKIIFLVNGSGVQLTTRRALAERLYGSLAVSDDRDLTNELLEDRQQEAASKRW
jgi:bifunctional DNA-binding transcriptional regulator/antitoxin component of YhaV-PrlF toxin-antitoxin module